MKADRRHQLASNALARELEGFPGFLKRQANTILTILLVIASIVLLFNWRIASVKQAQQMVLNQLSVARARVQSLRNPYLSTATPKELADERIAAETAAGQAVSDVLNKASDPKLKAEALVTRGNLYWELANLPPLPDASSTSTSQPSESNDLLQKSADAYNQVLQNADYAKDQEAAINAHFGLAAIAENRSQWEIARQQLEAVANDPAAPKSLVQQANGQLGELPLIQTPLYLAPATQPANIANISEPLGPAFNPGLPSMAPSASSQPATTQPSH